MSLPAVPHLRDGHFVVLVACGQLGPTIGDAARGVVTVRLPEFLAAWSGVVVLLRPPAAPSPSVAESPDAENARRWAALQAAAATLPPDLRAVYDLVFTRRLAHGQVAEQLGVDERTSRRRWRAACQALERALGGELPVPRQPS